MTQTTERLARGSQELPDVSELGYWSFETVSPMIEALDKDGALAGLIEKYRVPVGI